MTTCKRSRVGRRGLVVLKDFGRIPGFSLPDDRFASASLVRKENSEVESKVILSSTHVHMYGSARCRCVQDELRVSWRIPGEDRHKHQAYKWY